MDNAPVPRQRSPWFYVLLGCGGLAGLMCLGLGGSGLYCAKQVSDINQGVTDPRERQKNAEEQLGAVPELADRRLRRWAHMLGFRGHIASKSRRYSTTMTALRRARVEHRVRQRYSEGGPVDPWGRPLDVDEDTGTVLLIADWRFAGVGHRSAGDAWLAESAAANARDRRYTARLALQTTAGGGDRPGGASFP